MEGEEYMTKELTKGTPWKVIALFAIPIFIGNIFQQVYNLADTMIVGNTLGLHALGAVGLTGCLSFLILGFCSGITSGFAVPVAQAFGARDHDRMRHYVGLSVIWCVVVTVVMTLIACLGVEPLLKLMQTPENLFDDAYAYIVIIFAGLGCNILYNMSAGILRSVGDSRTPLYFLIFATVVNIGVDFLFICAFKMGVSGAAYATIISQGMAGALCVGYIMKKFKILHLHKKDFRMDWKMTGEMFGIGLPMAFQFSVTAVGAVILQRTVNDFGVNVVSAYSAANKVENLMVQTFQTLGIAMATYCAQNKGAGNYDRVLRGVRSAFIMTTICAVFSALMNILTGPALLHMFTDEITAETMRAAKTYLYFMAAGYWWFALLFLYRNVLQGVGRSVFPFFAGVVEFVIRLLLCMLALNINLPDWERYLIVCFASPGAWVAAAIFLFIRYRFYAGELKRHCLKGN